MKIIYYANFGNQGSDNTEQQIKFALEKLGHTVVPVEETAGKVEVIEKSKDADLFLFHKG